MLGYNTLSGRIKDIAAANEEAANRARMDYIRDSLAKRSGMESPDYEGIGKTLASHMGGKPDERATAYQKLGASGQAAYADMAARQSKPGAVAGLHGLFAKEGREGEIARAGLIGGAGVGGALGLTAAGQQLMNLMAYLQQGQETDVKRDQELV